MSTRTKPDGGALAGVVEKFIAQAKNEAKANGSQPEAVIRKKLEDLAEMVNGYDFAEVIAAYAPYIALRVGDTQEGWVRLEGEHPAPAVP